MARTIGRKDITVKYYLVSRGLYDSWRQKALGGGVFFPPKSSPSSRGPLWLKDRKNFPTYDPANIYGRGQTLFFEGLGAGEIVQVDGRQIVVKFEKERRRYVHGLQEDPYQRRKSVD